MVADQHVVVTGRGNYNVKMTPADAGTAWQPTAEDINAIDWEIFGDPAASGTLEEFLRTARGRLTAGRTADASEVILKFRTSQGTEKSFRVLRNEVEPL